jgi:membrane associated rhomboid family serine protease
MVLLALFFLHTGPWSSGSQWFERGAINSAAILGQGEWWRLVTALTLHADLVHLVGNSLIGGLIIHLLSKTIGYGFAWLCLLLNGATGNLLNIILRRQPHISVGLSTAVFAAIGMLTGLQLGRFTSRSLRDILLPLGAGAGLLAFLGSEGVHTDLGAHFFGFIIGICSGVLLSYTDLTKRLQRPAVQGWLLLFSLMTLLLCWRLALR